MKHKTKHPLYQLWGGVIARCERPGSISFKNYGARGVRICPEWRSSFDAFVASVGERPTLQHSLDRLDNSKGYEPGNVRWATRMEQLYNRRNTRRFDLDGVSMTRDEMAEKFGLSLVVIIGRSKRGWTPREMVGLDPRAQKPRVQTPGQIASARKKAERTHCLHGHEFTKENTVYEREGYRKCRECGNSRRRAAWRAKHPLPQ